MVRGQYPTNLEALKIKWITPGPSGSNPPGWNKIGAIIWL